MRIEFCRLAGVNIRTEVIATFRLAEERNIDFILLFSSRSLTASEKDRINALLETNEVRNAAVSVSVGRITGKGFTFSPKLPYVSEDGIIVNVKRCEELGIPERVNQMNSHSHFEDAGGIHATLLSFLESVVPYGELYSYAYEGDFKDAYKSWQTRAVRRILQPLKGIFNKVNYEIQKKYEEKT